MVVFNGHEIDKSKRSIDAFGYACQYRVFHRTITRYSVWLLKHRFGNHIKSVLHWLSNFMAGCPESGKGLDLRTFCSCRAKLEMAKLLFGIPNWKSSVGNGLRVQISHPPYGSLDESGEVTCLQNKGYGFKSHKSLWACGGIGLRNRLKNDYIVWRRLKLKSWETCGLVPMRVRVPPCPLGASFNSRTLPLQDSYHGANPCAPIDSVWRKGSVSGCRPEGVDSSSTTETGNWCNLVASMLWEHKARVQIPLSPCLGEGSVTANFGGVHQQ